MNVALLQRQLAYRLRRMGWPAVSGVALMVLAGAGAVAPHMANSARIDQLDHRLARLKLSANAPANERPTSATEQLMAFYDEFPRVASVPDWLGNIHVIAKQQQLALDVGDYTLTHVHAGRLDKFRIAFPVKGSYPQIRKFIRAALAMSPALALDSIYLKRDNASEAAVEARIVFQLYLENRS